MKEEREEGRKTGGRKGEEGRKEKMFFIRQTKTKCDGLNFKITREK